MVTNCDVVFLTTSLLLMWILNMQPLLYPVLQLEAYRVESFSLDLCMSRGLLCDIYQNTSYFGGHRRRCVRFSLALTALLRAYCPEGTEKEIVHSLLGTPLSLVITSQIFASGSA
jgi:hypothetical protein